MAGDDCRCDRCRSGFRWRFLCWFGFRWRFLYWFYLSCLSSFSAVQLHAFIDHKTIIEHLLTIHQLAMYSALTFALLTVIYGNTKTALVQAPEHTKARQKWRAIQRLKLQLQTDAFVVTQVAGYGLMCASYHSITTQFMRSCTTKWRWRVAPTVLDLLPAFSYLNGFKSYKLLIK